MAAVGDAVRLICTVSTVVADEWVLINLSGCVETCVAVIKSENCGPNNFQDAVEALGNLADGEDEDVSDSY